MAIVNLYHCKKCGPECRDRLVLESTVFQGDDGDFHVEVMDSGHYCGQCDDSAEIDFVTQNTLFNSYGEMVWRWVLGEYLIERLDDDLLYNKTQGEFVSECVLEGYIGLVDYSYQDMINSANEFLIDGDGVGNNLFVELELFLCAEFGVDDHDIHERWGIPTRQEVEDAQREDHAEGMREERMMERER